MREGLVEFETFQDLTRVLDKYQGGEKYIDASIGSDPYKCSKGHAVKNISIDFIDIVFHVLPKHILLLNETPNSIFLSD